MQSVSKGSLWAGRIIGAVVVLIMVFDAVAKLMKARQVIEAAVRIGFPESTIVRVGAALLFCTALYVILPTSVLGAIPLTGYLGGAVAPNVRAGTGVFNAGFPIIFAVLVWLGLFLRESRLRTLIPLRAGKPS